MDEQTEYSASSSQSLITITQNFWSYCPSSPLSLTSAVSVMFLEQHIFCNNKRIWICNRQINARVKSSTWRLCPAALPSEMHIHKHSLKRHSLKQRRIISPSRWQFLNC